MKEWFTFIGAVVLLFSCMQDHTVQISGRVENGDSIVSIWVEDSIYAFPLDENGSFSGEIRMKHGGYATFLHNSLNLYLSPGEDLEIYVNALNFLGSLHFRGSLGGVNRYLKEQEGAVFFDKDYYALGESEFVWKMQELIDEKTKLLEAKNFDDSFTRLEKERIRYSVAERVSFYPIYRNRMYPGENYRPGAVFSDFLSSFSLNNEDLFATKDYRSFLLNYVYLQGSRGNGSRENYSDGVVDYILSTVNNPTIKNFLLTEIVFHHIRENNGLNGADYLLSVFRREVTDPSKVAYMEEIIGHWEKLLPGKPAPSFTVRDRYGEEVSLEQFRGKYLYITVWATWCVPCKSELPYLDVLQKEYMDKDIHFLTIAIGESANQKHWKDFLAENFHAGIHTFADAKNEFNKDYMIISVPRFILIGPDGVIIDANAPRPSGQIRLLLDELGIRINGL